MPGKSRRRRGRNSVQGKKRKSQLGYPSRSTQQSAVTRPREPAASPSVSVSLPTVPAPIAKPATVQYPYIAAELRTIGILASIMLIVLVVLALLLA